MGDFSQKGSAHSPPLGKWQPSRREGAPIEREGSFFNAAEHSYHSLVLEAVEQHQKYQLHVQIPSLPSGPYQKMNICVHSLAGETLCTLTVENELLWHLREKIHKDAKVPFYQQRLLVGCVELPHTDVPIRSVVSGEHIDITLIRIAEEQAEWVERVVKIGPRQLANAPDHIRADRATVWIAALHDVRALQYAFEETLLDDDFIITLMQQHADIARHVPPKIAMDQQFLRKCSEMRAAGKLGKSGDGLYDPMRQWT